MYVQYSHCDQLMHLFAVQQFGKIDLNLKNKRVAFSSQRNIHYLDETTYTYWRTDYFPQRKCLVTLLFARIKVYILACVWVFHVFI